MWLLLILIIPAHAQLLYTPQNFTSTPCSDQNHLFLVPGLLTAGSNSRACLSRFYPDGHVNLVISLITEDGNTVAASRDLPPGDGGCLDIAVPQKPNTKVDLQVNVRYLEANCVWTQRVAARIASTRLVLITTERGRYRPGDAVRFRVIALKSDLTPAHTTIEEIWLEGPYGVWDVKAAQWLRVRTRLGLAQLQHDLDELAPPGKWTLRARLEDGSLGSTSFWVGNYELPPFQLTVKHSPKVLRSSERLSWTVCVRYPWAEAVEGMLVIRIRGASGRGDSGIGIRTAVRLRAPRACHRHAAAARRIGLNANNADIIIADFSFQEDGTRIWQNTTVVSRVVEEPVTLEFLSRHRPVVSPGLPYKLKIKATRWDDKPATNEPIRVCRSAARSADADAAANATCVDALTDDTGVARLMFTVEEHASPYYIFEARCHNSSVRLVALGAGDGGARAALGPLRAARARSLLPLYLRLPSNTTAPITVHFVVITRGGTIHRWGATTQCPRTSISDQIHTVPRNTICPSVSNSEEARNIISNSSDLMNQHTSKVLLPIKVSHQMCPDSYLLAYFYHAGELVTVSKHFEMEDCFGTTVEATWLTRQVLPGSISSLQLTTAGPALCALSVVDTAAKWVQPPENIKDVLMQELRKMMSRNRNITEYDTAGDCFLTTDDPAWRENSELVGSGMRIVGAGLKTPRCVREAQPLVTEDSTPRSDFSEAWLWRLVPVGTNGSATLSARAPDSITRFEATATCMSKSGIAISQPAVLQVFRELFIHADGAGRLRRGDATIFTYRLFNYLYKPLSVQIDILSDEQLQVTSERIEVVCVLARSSVARRVGVSARGAGVARLRIRATPTRYNACSNATVTASTSDEVIIQVQIDPEGELIHNFKSALICANTGFGISEESWKWPSVAAAAGSETLAVWASADLNGPLYGDADSLILLPRGCGEQNMERLATNFLAGQLLPTKASAAMTTRLHLTRGLTRQLQYVHPSGGFSAFGSSDPAPSTWLTAFCIRYLRRIYKELYNEAPVPLPISRAELWLVGQQMENGCFRSEGQVFHSELKGGIKEEGETASVALTAYVITALVESTAVLPYRLIRNSLSCLRALPPTKTITPSRVYAHALLAYAFMRLRRYEEELGMTNEASPIWNGKGPSGLKADEEMRELVELLKMARRSGEFVWWETDNLATSIEATGYALLALAECPPALLPNCAVDARGAVLWLSTHRNAGGGFISTQDTLVALEATIRWASLLPPSSNLTVRVRSGQTTKTIRLQPDVKIPEVIRMNLSDKLGVSVEGRGCALVQATRSYHSVTADRARHSSLSVDTTVRTDGQFNCDANRTLCFCAAVVEVCVVWRGPLPQMSLLELVLPAAYGADAALLYSQLQKKDTLLRRIELSTNNGRASLYLGEAGGSDNAGRAGHECFTVHVVGPAVTTKPGYARILDYYRPHITDSQMFTIPEDCPARISQDTPIKYTAYDNLYVKAKSLINNGEILITQDFSFEDIPEGIPVEDPIYDNITNRNNTENTADIVRPNAYKLDHVIAEPETINDSKNNENHHINNIENCCNNPLNNIEAIVLNNDTTPNNVKKEEDNEIATDNIGDKENIRGDTKIEITQSPEIIRNENEFVYNSKIQQMTPITTTDYNTQLANFHEIYSEKDLEVPSGIEGPVPAIVLPPKDFVYTDPPPESYKMEAPQFRQTFYNPNYFYFNRQYGIR